MNAEYQEVQWYSGGSGVGVRAWVLYGVTKVHLWTGEGRTLCGRKPALPSKRLHPHSTDARCKVCAKRAGTGEDE